MGVRGSCFSSVTEAMSVLNTSYFTEIQFSITGFALKQECAWKLEPGMLSGIYKPYRRRMLSLPLLLENAPSACSKALMSPECRALSSEGFALNPNCSSQLLVKAKENDGVFPCSRIMQQLMEASSGFKQRCHQRC